MEYSIDRLKELITKKNNTLTAKHEIFYKKDIEDKTLIDNLI